MAMYDTQEKRARHLENARRYRQRHPEKTRAASRLWRENNKERDIARKREWQENNPEKMRVARGRYKKKRPDAEMRYQRRRHIKSGATKVSDLLQYVSDRVPKTLPVNIREEVISSMVLDFLNGHLTKGKLAASVKLYITAQFKAQQTYSNVSLDAPIGGTDLRLIDILTDESQDDDLPEGEY